MGDGSLKMVAIKFFQGRKQLLDSVPSIWTARRFDKAFGRISMVVDNDGYTHEMIDEVARLDKRLAEAVRKNSCRTKRIKKSREMVLLE